MRSGQPGHGPTAHYASTDPDSRPRAASRTQVTMFACMGCREDDAFLTCFGGAPLAEEESEAEPEKAPRRKVKRRESKRRAARRPADPPPKPESRWGLVRRSVVKEPKLVEVVAEATAYYDVSEARDRLRERLGKGVSTAQTKRMMLDVGADQHGRVSPRDFEVMVARFEEDRLVKKSRRKFWRRRAKKPPKAPKELYAPSAIHADAKALAKPSAEINQCVRPAWRYYLLFWPPRRSARVLGVLARGVLGLLTRTFDFRTGGRSPRRATVGGARACSRTARRSS